MIAVGSMIYFNLVTTAERSFSIKYENLNLLFIGYIFVSGLIAISAMVLPDMLGSTIFLIFGLHVSILNRVKEILGLTLKN